MNNKKLTKAQLIKQFREEILAKYPHIKYERMFRAEGYPHLLFSTPNDDDFELTEKLAERANEIQFETGHYILAGVYTEEDLGVKKRK